MLQINTPSFYVHNTHYDNYSPPPPTFNTFPNFNTNNNNNSNTNNNNINNITDTKANSGDEMLGLYTTNLENLLNNEVDAIRQVYIKIHTRLCVEPITPQNKARHIAWGAKQDQWQEYWAISIMARNSKKPVIERLDTKQADKKSVTAFCQQKEQQCHPEKQILLVQVTEKLGQKEEDGRWKQYKKICNAPNVVPDDA